MDSEGSQLDEDDIERMEYKSVPENTRKSTVNGMNKNAMTG